MILKLTRKICPLMSLALMFSCGKKINEAGATNDGLLIDNHAPSNVLTLQVKEEVTLSAEFKLPRNAWFFLPEKLLVLQGSAIGKRVQIRYNVQDDGRYEFHCTYSSASVATEMILENCHQSTDDHGNAAVWVSGPEELKDRDFKMDSKTTIRMDLQNPNPSNLIINAVYQVEWK
jgi:hypothetical protein